MYNSEAILQLILGAIVVGLICLGISHWFKSQDNTSTGEKIYVYNWGEYIDPDLIKQFEKETGIQVVYETFDSNERWKLKFEMVERIMMWLFQVNIPFKIET